MRAQRLPSGAYRYRVYYYVGDQRRCKSFTDKDRETAKRAAEEFLFQKRRRVVSSGTVASMIDGYISAREPQLSPATVVGYRNIERRIREEFPAIFEAPAHTLERSDIQHVINALTASGAAPKTVRNVSAILVGALSENGIVIGPLALPAKRARNVSVPSEDEVRQLLAAASGTIVEIPVMLGAFAGLRRGEVCALRMEDVDLDRNIVHVCRDVVMGPGGEWIEKHPKTVASDRFVELPPFVSDRIRERGTIYDENPRMLSYRFRMLCESTLSVKYRFHDLRHFCASFLHANGIPDAYIMQRCGWENDAVLKAVYRHTMADQDKRFVQVANNLFSRF